jgi:adenylyltransferase/sulfurtransferase
MNNKTLTKEELARYSRHLTLPEVGKEGQEKLKQAKVLIIGAGGLGNSAAMYLAAAGIGTIGIVDFDKIELSNLQRQVLYSAEDIGKEKTTTIKKQLKKINNNIEILEYNEKLTSKNAKEIIKDYDLVIDGSDNFPTRYLVNDACVLLKKPNVYGSIFRFDGHASVFSYQEGPCYRCLFPNPPSPHLVPNCAEAGVLGVLPGIIGTIQATEAIKIILEKGDILSGSYLIYNALGMSFKKLKLKKNGNCDVCSKNPKIKELIDYEEFCNNKKEETNEITVKELKKLIDKKEDFILIDIREEFEQQLCKLNNAIMISFTESIKNNLSFFDNLDKNKKIVLYCHTGQRSSYTLNILKKKGFTNLKNLVGGIDAWAKEIDQEITIY